MVQLMDNQRAGASRRRKRPSKLVTGLIIIFIVIVIVSVPILFLQLGSSQTLVILTIFSLWATVIIASLNLLIAYLQPHRALHQSDELQTSPDASVSLETSTILLTSSAPTTRELPLLADSEEGGISTLNRTIKLPECDLNSSVDWGEAPRAAKCYGREEDINRLAYNLVEGRYHVLAVQGEGGIGKTNLAVKVAEQVQDDYAFIIWRSLLNAPSPSTILHDCIELISQQGQVQIPSDPESQISLLFKYLQEHRCLIVLDNVESILQSGHLSRYRQGYEAYGRLFQRFRETLHQSTLILTSREIPREIANIQSQSAFVHVYLLKGLLFESARRILQDKNLKGDDNTQERLVQKYQGNPLALQLVSQYIYDLFDGDIATFLAEEKTPLISGIRAVLDQQFRRLSPTEQLIMYWLVVEREPVTLRQLRENVLSDSDEVAEAVRSLQWRSFIENRGEGLLTLQNVIMEYTTSRFVKRVLDGILKKDVSVLETHALMKANAKDYVREMQIRLILKPLIQRLQAELGDDEFEQHLKDLLETYRLSQKRVVQPSYTAGNILNMLVQAGCSLRGYDFSRLSVRQAYLQGVDLQGVNFAYADVATSIFTDTFGNIFAIAQSHSTQYALMAAGTATNEVRIWHMRGTNSVLQRVMQGHTDWVRSVSFSPDDRLLVSGSDDQTICIWDLDTDRDLTMSKPLRTLSGHNGRVFSVSFSPSGQILVSGSQDQKIKLWDAQNGQCVKTLEGHEGPVYAVSFSHDGRKIVSGSGDGTVKLWDVSDGLCLRTLREHLDEVKAVVFSPDDEFIISGSADQTIRLWDANTGHCFQTLRDHTGRVKTVALSPDGTAFVSGGDDALIRLWDTRTGQCIKTLSGHTRRVWSLAFTSDARTIVSGSDDQSIRLWDVATGNCLQTLVGRSDWVYSVAFNPIGTMLASGSGGDGLIRIWNPSLGRLQKTLQGHTNWVRSVNFSLDGTRLASSGDDQTVRLWDTDKGELVNTFIGHSNLVYAVAFSPTSKILASASEDQTIRVWNVKTGECLSVLHPPTNCTWSIAFNPNGKLLVCTGYDQRIHIWSIEQNAWYPPLVGHMGWIYSATFSHKGKLLATASQDQTVRIWNLDAHTCRHVLTGHTSWVHAVAFSPDDRFLASVSQDRTVRLWNVGTGQCEKIFVGHESWIYSVAYDPKGRTLASGDGAGAVRIWDISTEKCLHELRNIRPYEHMNITGIRGIDKAQMAILHALGAIDGEQ